MARYTSMGCGCNFAYTISCPALKIPERPCTTGVADGTFITGSGSINTCVSELWAFGGVQCAINADFASDPDFNNILTSCCVLKTCPCVQFAFATTIGACPYLGTYYWRTRLISDSYEVSAFSNTGCVCTCANQACLQFALGTCCCACARDWAQPIFITTCCCTTNNCYGPYICTGSGTCGLTECCIVLELADTANNNSFSPPMATFAGSNLYASSRLYVGSTGNCCCEVCALRNCLFCGTTSNCSFAVNVCGENVSWQNHTCLVTRCLANSAIAAINPPNSRYIIRTITCDADGVKTCNCTSLDSWSAPTKMYVFALDNAVGCTPTQQGCCCIQLYGHTEICYPCYRGGGTCGVDPTNLAAAPIGVFSYKYEVSYDCTFTTDVITACGPLNVFIPKASITGWGSCPQFYVRMCALYAGNSENPGDMGITPVCAKIPNVTFTNWTACYACLTAQGCEASGQHSSACCSGTINHTGEIYAFQIGSGGIPWFWCYGACPQTVSCYLTVCAIPCDYWCRLKICAGSPSPGTLVRCVIDNTSGAYNGCTFCMRAGMSRISSGNNLNVCRNWFTCRADTGCLSACSCEEAYWWYICGVINNTTASCKLDNYDCLTAASWFCICGTGISLCAKPGASSGGGGPSKPITTCGSFFNSTCVTVCATSHRGQTGALLMPDANCTSGTAADFEILSCNKVFPTSTTDITDWLNAVDPYSPTKSGEFANMCAALQVSQYPSFCYNTVTGYQDGSCYCATIKSVCYGCTWCAVRAELGCYDTPGSSYVNSATSCGFNLFGLGGRGYAYRISSNVQLYGLADCDNGQRGFGFGAGSFPWQCCQSLCFEASSTYCRSCWCCTCAWTYAQVPHGGAAGLVFMCNHPAAYMGYGSCINESAQSRVGLVTFACQGFGD